MLWFIVVVGVSVLYTYLATTLVLHCVACVSSYFGLARLIKTLLYGFVAFGLIMPVMIFVTYDLLEGV